MLTENKYGKYQHLKIFKSLKTQMLCTILYDFPWTKSEKKVKRVSNVMYTYTHRCIIRNGYEKIIGEISKSKKKIVTI